MIVKSELPDLEIDLDELEEKGFYLRVLDDFDEETPAYLSYRNIESKSPLGIIYSNRVELCYRDCFTNKVDRKVEADMLQAIILLEDILDRQGVSYSRTHSREEVYQKIVDEEGRIRKDLEAIADLKGNFHA